MLAIDLGEGSERVNALWNLVRSEASPGVILDEVVRSGLSAAPQFVLVGGGAGSQTTVLVRGSAVLRVSGLAGEREISGEGVSSWVEQVLDTTNGFELQVAPIPRGIGFLPLESGVVRAASLKLGTAPGQAHLDTPTPVRARRATVAKVEHADVVAEIPALDLEATLAAEQTTSMPVEPESAGHGSTVTIPAEAADVSGYDHLFGETVVRKVEDAAVREIGTGESGILVGPPPSSAPVEAEEVAGDHDGHTVMVSDLAALRAKRKAARSAAPLAEPPAPTLYLELSTGGREQLDQPLIIGRAPSASRVPGGKVPRLVSMNTPNQDISRTHAQISSEGGTVVVTDLHSSNGTTVILPGKAPQKLRPGEPSAVIVGTVIDLGDGATLTVCESL